MSESATNNRTLRFGKYVLQRRLRSEGGHIEVFATSNPENDEACEIRIVNRPAEKGSPIIKRFIHELKMLARIRHHGVIRIIEAGYIQGRAYFTTPLRNSLRLDEYVDGRGGALPPDVVLRFAVILADAAAALHSRKIVHRTLSASSVFVDIESDAPYIGECSAMKDLRFSGPTEAGFPALTEIMPSPEGFSGADLDERTDVFLLSAIYYWMLTGRYPRADGTDQLKLRLEGGRIIPLPAPMDLIGMGAMPESFEEVIMRGLAIEPKYRFASALELTKALRMVSAGG